MTSENKISKTIEELEAETRKHIVYDLRKQEDYEKETYPGALNLYWEEFEAHISEIPRNIPIYLLCYTGVKGKDIAEKLAEQDYEIYNVDGGYRSYLRVKLKRMMERADAGENVTEKKSDCADENVTTKKSDDTDIDWDSLTQTEYCKYVERSIVKKFRKDIWRKFTQAINEYDMIQDGDKIAVCISGGKDSMLMAKLFQELERHGRKNFEVVYLVMNPGYNAINYETILNNAKLLNVPITVFESDIFNIVADEGNSPCYLCARMRRGYLYSHARELGCNKIALGHHYDDVIETILMGMLYGGQIQTMMPKLHSTNFEGMELIRPLYLVREEAIIHWRDYNHLHFIQCACRFTENCASCGGTEKGSKRAEIKELIRALAEHSPVIEKNIFRSVENVNLSTIIEYKKDGVKHHFLDEY
jgi:tRNA(Ile)-lysidine synthase TilS/MesJ/rhodanese-related sulfurtransferase